MDSRRDVSPIAMLQPIVIAHGDGSGEADRYELVGRLHARDFMRARSSRDLKLFIAPFIFDSDAYLAEPVIFEA